MLTHFCVIFSIKIDDKCLSNNRGLALRSTLGSREHQTTCHTTELTELNDEGTGLHALVDMASQADSNSEYPVGAPQNPIRCEAPGNLPVAAHQGKWRLSTLGVDHHNECLLLQIQMPKYCDNNLISYLLRRAMPPIVGMYTGLTKPTHTPKNPTLRIAQLNPKVPNPLQLTNGKIKTQRMSLPLLFLFITSLSFHFI